MSQVPFQPSLDFAAAQAAAESGEALVLDLDGYEGPLHVLLALARAQKVDLLSLSITALAEQYLAFVRSAEHRRFALAADYLVMASWLAYLKSRLLLPAPEKPSAEEPPAAELAQQLAFRLAKLDAMRRAAAALAERPQLGRDVHARGGPERLVGAAERRLDSDLYGLMSAYVGQRRRQVRRRYAPRGTTAYPLEDARRRLRGMLDEMRRWTPLSVAAPEGAASQEDGPARASCVASTLSAGLELVKEGTLEARQAQPFDELYLRRRAA